jgi:Transposase DDE domain
MQSQRRLLSVLGRARANLTTQLDEKAINTACRAENHSWRDRRFNPTNTIHTFITQVFHGNTALTDLPRVTGETFSGSAFGKARKRLPLAVFQRLLRRLSAALIPKSKADGDECDGRWLGHRVFMMDGSSASMPDTPELQQHFGQPGGQRPGCGFPVVHLTYLFHAGTGLIREVLTAPLRTHDMSQAIHLHPAFEPGDVGVGDRGFCSYAHLALLSLRKAFGVFRLHQRKKTRFEIHHLVRDDDTTAEERRLPRWLSQLGAMDQRVEWVKPQKPPAWMSAEQYAQLPERLVVRELRYLVGKRGFRTKEVTLVTTLLDAELYPLEALAELYRQRWQVEQHLRELKQTMNMDVLKCKKVDGVLKELTIYAIVYNLVRVVLQAAARLQKQPLFRLSFIDALRWLRSAGEGAKLSKIEVNPYRPNRVEPRVVKRRPKQYRRMTAPRSVLRQRLLAGPAAA